jgi:hypothetical protein
MPHSVSTWPAELVEILGVALLSGAEARPGQAGVTLAGLAVGTLGFFFFFLSHSVSTCLAELVAHLGIAFLFLTWLVSHTGLLGLSEFVAELLPHFGFSSVGQGYFYGTLSFDLSS